MAQEGHFHWLSVGTHSDPISRTGTHMLPWGPTRHTGVSLAGEAGGDVCTGPGAGANRGEPASCSGQQGAIQQKIWLGCQQVQDAQRRGAL